MKGGCSWQDGYGGQCAESEGGRGTKDSGAPVQCLPGCRLAQQAPSPSDLGGTSDAPFPGHFPWPIVGHGTQTGNGQPGFESQTCI